MTCIAAVAEKGRVYIGADSAAVDGWDLSIRPDEKVFANGLCIFGFICSFRMGQLLRYQFTVPKRPADMTNRIFMHTLFIEEVRTCLKKGGYAKVEDNVEKGGTFIVGYDGIIYMVENDFQIYSPRDQFDACGCGHAYAKAVLYATRGRKDNPRERIKLALTTAEHFSAGVRGPFKILCL